MVAHHRAAKPKAVRCYHGTCAKFVPSILKEGLKPGLGHGADDWALHHGHAGIARMTAKHAPSVFVSLNREMAESFANIVAEENTSSPRLVELEIPERDFVRVFREDEPADSRPLTQLLVGVIDFRTTQTIPPAWIKGVSDHVPHRLAPVL